MTVVFLSASVPDPNRDPRFHDSADVIAIRDAVRALATVVLPVGRLVWGGHPAITPLIRVVADGLKIHGGDRVRIFQSRFFKNMPKDNRAFEKVIKIPAVAEDRNASLLLMRKRMISSEEFTAGIFIGGMEGVEEEYRLFVRANPGTPLFPVASTGAAARFIYDRRKRRYPMSPDLRGDLAYPSLFRRLLNLAQ